jgi:hypothetical protein
MSRIRRHLTYANVMATLAVFLVLGGGTAVALNGTNTVQSDDLGPGAQVKAPDVADNAVNSQDVSNQSLTGRDVKDQSGVDTCVLTVRIGQLCVRAENFARPWRDAFHHCANLDLRLPTLGEALELAQTHDIPNVGQNESFWTGDRYLYAPGNDLVADTVSDSGGDGYGGLEGQAETVCVTTPTN